MGNCCPCFKSSESNEYVAIPTAEVNATPAVELNSTQYYQTVLDDARKKFLNTTSGTNRVTSADAQNIRNKLDVSQLDNKTTEKSRSEMIIISCDRDSTQSIIEDLNKPVAIYNMDVVADELAEIIAKHTVDLRIDDTSTSSIAAFKIAVPT